MEQKRYTVLLSLLFISAAAVQAQTVWNGPAITFTKAAGADFTQAANQDRMTPATWITRGNTQGIFNIAPGKETIYTQNVSPANTEWATGTLANYAALTYQPWQVWAGGRLNIPAMVGKDAVLHLKSENIYIGIRFLSWDIGAGGFSYQRTTAAIPAPVTLAGFAATQMKNSIALQWRTATEENTASFTVERSADGRQFDAIGTVEAAGNSATEKRYTFVDASPLSSNFYRLRTTDIDGSFSYSFVVAYKMNRASGLLLFPNPAVGVIHLQYSAKDPATAEVMDAAGRVVKCISLPAGDNALNVDITSLRPGIYILKTGNESRQFLKQ